MSLTVEIQKQLGDFRLEVQFEAEHERLALLGASGCGKSVTLRCIAGILTPDAGRIILDGRTLFDSAEKINLPPQQRRVGYLFQQYALFPNMTVAQNIAVAVRNKARRLSAVAESLRAFRLEEVAGQKPWQLSGGQQQRTALARILVSEPEAILLDEPFSALDSYLKYQLELELHDTLSGFPGSVLWVSHDRGEVWRNCGRVCVIDRGRSQPVQTMEELFHTPGTESAARLSGCKNYVSAFPRGDSVDIPAWGCSFRCGQAVPEGTVTIGIRSHHIIPGEGENAVSCDVERVIDDVFATIVLLRPSGSQSGAPLLRMELSKEAWAVQPDQAQLTVSIAPQNILLLK